MKAVILAGGRGTRISEESVFRPKPMVEIGGKPILWHIMKTYSAAGVNEFVVCLGYKGQMIKEYFANYFTLNSDVTFDLAKNEVKVHRDYVEPWKVTLVDTGADSMTGGRIKRIASFVGDEDFCMTYGDGVGNVDVAKVIEFHKSHGGAATMTSVLPTDRFGVISVGTDGKVDKFVEKPKKSDQFINAGYFVLKPKVFDYITDDMTIWEQDPMRRLAAEGELHAYSHDGFWHAMDTLRDKATLEEMWTSGKAPWKIWED